MQRFFYFSLIFSFLVLSSGFAQDADVATEVGTNHNLNLVTTPLEDNMAVLFDNGPIITLASGGCSGGAVSVLDGTVGGHTLYGWGFQQNIGNYMADDFTNANEWDLDSIKVYSYQTSATSSTITGLYVQIWNGAPNAGGTIVWGNLTTNRLQRTAMVSTYRAQSTTVTDCARRIQEIVATVDVTLPAGTYWIQFGATGSAASGPWCPPVTIAGQAVTGNALQLTSTGWAPALNGTSANGAPFILYGTEAGGAYSFFEDFDDMTAGQKVACQDTVNWTTWSNAPCGSEDGMVTNVRASSTPNSALIVQNNDLVKLHGDLNTGKWYTGFRFYIPTGKSGYFNMLSSFNQYWAFECYFNVNGAGLFQTGDPDAPFTWQQNTWQWCEVVIDLGLDQAQFYINGSVSGTLVKQWAWSNTQSGAGGPLIIDAHDFFGAAATDEMYFDDFFIGPNTLTPVELLSFGANANDAGNVIVHWSTGTEINNQVFEIERSAEDGDFYLIGHVNGRGTTTEVQNYTFTDNSVTPGKYYYRLKQIDFSGAYEYSNAVEVVVTPPLAYSLGQNYPNPFNPSTQIAFSLAEPTMVKLAVYNLLGQEVQVLKNEFMLAGQHQVSFNANDLPSGTYIYKIETANFTQARKLMLMK